MRTFFIAQVEHKVAILEDSEVGGLGLRAQGLGLRALGFGLWALGFGLRAWGLGLRA